MNITDTHNKLLADQRHHATAEARPHHGANRGTHHAGQERSHVGNIQGLDKLFLDKLRPQQASSFLAQHINRGLRENFQLEQPQHRGFANQSEEPRTAINQIIQTASQALRKLIPEHGVESAAQKVRDNIDQNYNEATDIFGVFGNLAKETRQRLQEARELLDKAYQQAPLNGDARETEELFVNSRQYTSQTNTSLSIETTDGDRITIDLSHSLERSSKQLTYDTNGKSLSYRENQKNESYQLNIHVEGNLDEDEKKAVGQLIKQLNEAGEQHDKGNSQDALKLAGELAFDSNIIKSFDYEKSTGSSLENTSYIQQQTATPLSVEEAPVSNIIQEFSFLPFKDMRKAVQAFLDKLAEFRVSLDETLSKPPSTPVTEEA